MFRIAIVLLVTSLSALFSFQARSAICNINAVSPVKELSSSSTESAATKESKATAPVGQLAIGCDDEVNPPGKPSSITYPGTSTSGNYTVSWGGSTGFSGFSRTYFLQESINGGTYSHITSVNSSTRSYAVSGKTNGDYKYRVKACNDTSCSVWRTSTSKTLVRKKPTTPAAINNVNSTSSSVALNWSKPSGTVTYYSIQYRVAGGSWSYLTSNTGSTATTRSHTGRSNNTNYEYKVRACNGYSWACSGYGAVNSVKVRFKPSTPAKPADINSTSTSYTVSWSKPSGTVSFYSLQERVAGGSWSTIASSTTALSNARSGKINGTNYEYRVRACNSYTWACSSYSSTNSVKVRLKPSTPAAPSRPSTSTGSAAISWTKPTGNVSYYDVQKRFNNAGSWLTGSNGVTTTSRTLSSLTDGLWDFRVRACNGYSWACSGYSSVSNDTNVRLKPSTPSAPSRPSTSTGSAAVSWVKPAGSVTYYDLQKRLNNSASWSTAKAGDTNTSETVSGLTDGLWDFRVRACNGYSWACTSYSSVSSDTTVRVKPSTPAAPSRPSTSTGSAVISWAKPSGNVSYYDVQKRFNNAGSWLTGSNGVTTTSKTLGSLTDGLWDFRVRACNGYSWACSGYSGVSSDTEVRIKPSMPAKPTLPSTDTNGSYTVNWTKPSGTVSYYDLQERTNNTGSWVTVANNTSVLSEALTGRVNNTFDYRVRACNTEDWACGSYSSISSDIVVLYVPATPASITVPSQDADGSFAVSWGIASGQIGDYRLQEQKNGGSWVNVQTGSTATSKTLTGRTDGSFNYRVRACNVSGCSSYRTGGNSLTVLLKPSTPATPTLPTSSNNGSFTVSWVKPNGVVTSYDLQRKLGSGNYSTVYSGSSKSLVEYGVGEGTWTYRVRACNSSGCSNYSGTKGIVVNYPDNSVAPNPPSTNNGSVLTVDWTSSTFNGFILKEYPGGRQWQRESSATELLISAPTTDGSYNYSLTGCRVVNEAGAAQPDFFCGSEGPMGTSVLVRHKPSTAAAPSVPDTTITVNSVALNWVKPAGTVTKYYVEKEKNDSGSWSRVGSSLAATTKTVPSLTDGNWKFRILACNEHDWSCSFGAESAQLKYRPIPTIPSVTLSASNSTSGSVNVQWTGAGTPIYYDIQTRSNQSSSNWNNGPTNVQPTSKSVGNLADGTWDFRLRACNEFSWACSSYGGESTEVVVRNMPVVTTPIAPAVDNDGVFDVSWNSVSGIGVTYTLKQSVNGGTSWTNAYSGTATKTSTPLSFSTESTVLFKLQACKDIPNSCATSSNATTVVDFPDTTTTVSVPVKNPGTVFQVTFPAMAGMGFKLTEVQTGRKWELKGENLDTNRGYSINAPADGDYTYKVASCFVINEGGGAQDEYRCGSDGPVSNVIKVLRPPVLQGSLGFSADVYTGDITLTWPGATPNSDYYKVTEINSGTIQTINEPSLTTVFAGRADGTFNYKYESCNELDYCSGESASDSFYLLNVPSPVVNLVAPTDSNTGIFTLDWQDSTGQVDFYQVTDQSGTSIDIGMATDFTPAAKPDGTFSYDIQACNASGCSYTETAAVNVFHPVPVSPAGFSIIAGKSRYVELNWTPSSLEKDNGTDAPPFDDYYAYRKVGDVTWLSPPHRNAAYEELSLPIPDPITFNYEVRACNEIPGGEKCSAPSVKMSSTSVVLPEEWAETVPFGMPLEDSVFSLPSDPVANQSIGAVQGQAGVSGGAASYSIPIALPPGRAGMQPNVSLNYSSRGGNGIAGMGWGLSVGSAISRCASTEAQDQQIGGVTYVNDDRICLDGQRLLEVANNKYRTEIDSFQQITKFANLNDSWARFEVITKSGIKRYFGSTPNSRIVPSGAPATLTWLLQKEEDPSGNIIEYQYIQKVDGEVQLEEVIYTGHGTTPGNRKVVFEYEPRNDRSSSYLAGGLTRQTERLKFIRTYYDLSLVRRYTLNYTYSLASQKSLLANIQECADKAGQTSCLPITQFNWHDKAIEYKVEKLGYRDSLTGPIVPQLQDKVRIQNVIPHGDRDGDGAVDWQSWSMDAEGVKTNSNINPSNTCHFNFYTHQLNCVDADFNRDGKTDSWKSENGVLKIAFEAGQWTPTTVPITNGSYPQQTADFNGDGWPDLVIYEYNNGQAGPELILYLHSQNKTAPYSNNGQVIYTYDWTSLGYIDPWKPAAHPKKESDAQFVGDLDGNGLPDFIHGKFTAPGGNAPQAIPTTAFLTKLDSNKNVYFESIDLQGHAFPGGNFEHFFTYFMDVNGDGLTDWLSWESDTVANINEISLSLNKGNASFTQWQGLGADAALAVRNYIVTLGPSEPFDRNYPKHSDNFRQLDINSDGKPELLVPGANLVQACATLTAVRIDGGSYENTFCGSELYGTIRTAGPVQQAAEIPIWSADLDDGIYRWDAIYFDEQADGTYIARREATDIIGSPTQNVALSAFGNGLTDFIFTYGARFTGDVTLGSGAGTPMGDDYGVYINRNLGTASTTGSKRYELIDTLESVLDTGLNVESRWTYRPLSSRDLDSVANGEHYKITGYSETVDAFNFTSSMYVVAEFETSDGIGGFNQSQYRYRDAVYNYKGRGFQGFRTIIVDSANDNRAVTDFHQTFPKAGKVQTIRTCLVSNDDTCSSNPISKTDIGYFEVDTTASGNKWVIPAKSVKTSFDLKSRSQVSQSISYVGNTDPDPEGDWIGLLVDSTGYDLYGNILKSVSTVDNGFSTVTSSTTNNYTNDTVAWWFKLDDSTVNIETTTGSILWESMLDPIKQIETSYTYYDDNRLPDLVTAEPKLGGGKTTVIDTDYNLYGLPTDVRTYESGFSGNTRSIQTNYSNDGETQSNDGYFVYQVTNDLSHTVTTTTYPEHGQPKSVTDANGLQTTSLYDAFGRVEQVTPPVGTGQPAYSRFAECGGGCDLISDSNIVYKLTTSQAGAPETNLYKDQFNRVLYASTQGFDGSVIYVKTSYDNLDRKTFQSVPSNSPTEIKGVHFEDYDDLSRLTLKTTDEPDGQSFTVEYIYNNHVTNVKATGSRGTLINMYRTHSGTGQLMQTTDAYGGETRYAYDGQGNPIVLQDANSNSIKAQYNALGQKNYVNDPNMGLKSFTYTGFGEVKTEQDANTDTYEYGYDILGRIELRKLNGTTEAYFDYDGVCNGGIDQEYLANATAFTKTFGYDNYCRPDSLTTTIDGQNFIQKTQYDGNYGRVKGIQNPAGLTVETQYNDYGYATRSQNAASGYVYQEVTQMNARGQLTAAYKANGVLREVLEYTHETGQMDHIWTDTVLGGNQRHRISYLYDDFGNLEKQTVENMVSGSVQESEENYRYDLLHRLTHSDRLINGIADDDLEYRYDAVGNITRKDDFAVNGSYVYGEINKTNGNAGPNAVRSVGKASGGTAIYRYDLNGNMTGGDGKDIAYNAFNKPLTIEKANIKSTFSYGSSQMRFKQVKTGVQGGTETTVYIDKAYEEITQNGVTKKRSYLGDAIITETVGGTNDGHKIGFVHRDRLNSVVTITDENGNVVDNKSFDPFGKPRKGTMEQVDPSNSATLSVIAQLEGYELHTNRGFTDHEHLDDAELIHMNGRVYDYNLGRFLSVDPFIQDPGNSQSMNPYSYIMNNPLAGTDPSGYRSLCSVDKSSGCNVIDYGSYKSGSDPESETDNGSVESYLTNLEANQSSEDIDFEVEEIDLTIDVDSIDLSVPVTGGTDEITSPSTSQDNNSEVDAVGIGVGLVGVSNDIAKDLTKTDVLLKADNKFALDDKTYKNGFCGNQYVCKDVVADSKLKTARLATVGKVAGKAAPVVSAVLVVYYVNQYNTGEISGQQLTIELAKIGVPIAIGIASAPAGASVGGLILANEIIQSVVIPSAIKLHNQAVEVTKPWAPTADKNIFQVWQSNLQSEGARSESEHEGLF